MPEELSNDDPTRAFSVLSTGVSISHYTIVRHIGAGGMGEVYLAEDTDLKRNVAFKFMPTIHCANEELKIRFKREAQTAASLNHPNIITIHEVGEHQGRPYFVMEYLPGQPLQEYVKNKNLSIDQIAGLCIQIAEGLNSAHQSGVIHRDIKPSNIIVDDHGHAKIVDFGLATAKGADKITRTGSTLGTIGYMSPEQVHGRDADARSDLFSMGVVMYEIVAGRRPFIGATEAAVLHSITHDAIEPLRRFKADVSDDCERVISKLLEKDPALRYQTAADLISDLKKLAMVHDVVQDRRPKQRSMMPFLIGGLIMTVAIILGYIGYQAAFAPDDRGSDRTMLAVLPFDNLGAPEDDYFADGITDEIITNLAKLSGLGVISRKSAMTYKGTEKSLRDIGKELGVEYVLEGTVLWDKSGAEPRVRINPQLIQVTEDVHIWAEGFDAVINDIFIVQASVAQKVVEALNVTLLETERRALSEKLTDNPEAYDYYLRGNQYYAAGTSEGFRNAEAMYLKAVEIADDFAAAYAKLGMTHTQMYWYYHDRAPERLAAARDAVDRALALSPDLAEAHFALGWYYYHGHFDYDRALEEFAIAQERQPNNSRLIAAVAWVQRRQGKWDEAIANFRKVIKLDPRDAWINSELASTLVSVRQYAEADEFFDRAIDIAPDLRWTYFQKSMLNVFWHGNTQKAREIVHTALQRTNRWPMLTYTEIWLDMLDGEYNHASSLLTGPGAAYAMKMTDSVEYYYLKGDIYRHLGSDISISYYDSARVLLESYIAQEPDEPYFHLFLGRAYAGLGQPENALREGRRAIEMYPVDQDAFMATDFISAFAEICAIVGEDDLALDQLEYVLNMPSWTSINYVKICPDLKSLRDHPRFKALVTQHGG